MNNVTTVTALSPFYVMTQEVHLEHLAWCEAARREVVRVGDLASLVQQVQGAPTTGQPHVFTRYTVIRGHLTVQRNSSVTQVGLQRQLPFIAARME